MHFWSDVALFYCGVFNFEPPAPHRTLFQGARQKRSKIQQLFEPVSIQSIHTNIFAYTYIYIYII